MRGGVAVAGARRAVVLAAVAWAAGGVLALSGCAQPAVLRQPPGGPSMAEPRPGAPVPVTRLAEPTGQPPITLPDRGAR